MNTRKLINTLLITITLVSAPMALNATDLRKTKPAVWTAHTVDKAITAMYGHHNLIEKGVIINADKAPASGSTISINIKSDIDAKSVSLFQDANPEAAVIAIETNKHSIIDYNFKIKMKDGQRLITVVVEGTDGKLYAARHSLFIATGGCEG